MLTSVNYSGLIRYDKYYIDREVDIEVLLGIKKKSIELRFFDSRDINKVIKYFFRKGYYFKTIRNFQELLMYASVQLSLNKLNINGLCLSESALSRDKFINNIGVNFSLQSFNLAMVTESVSKRIRKYTKGKYRFKVKLKFLKNNRDTFYLMTY